MKKQFVSIIEEKEETGIFFRLPAQKRILNDWSMEGEDCWSWLQKAKGNLFIRFLNKRVFDGFEEWSEHENFGGITIKEFCSPIYFKRNIRKAFHVFNADHIIKSISVFGEEPYKNDCGGACILERTEVWFKNGERKLLWNKGAFHYAYGHVIEKEFC